MSTPLTAVCGLWPTPRRLVAVVEREGRMGNAASIMRTTEARWGFVVWLSASGVGTMVTTDALAADSLLGIAREEGLHVWLAPAGLVDAVRAAAALTRRAPRHTAALLARWPAQSVLRQHLRHLPPADTSATSVRQLHLW